MKSWLDFCLDPDGGPMSSEDHQEAYCGYLFTEFAVAIAQGMATRGELLRTEDEIDDCFGQALACARRTMDYLEVGVRS